MAIAPPPPKPAAPSQLKLETPNGNSIRFGLLVQPAYQVQNSTSTALGGYSENFFIRRTRILIGGSVMGAFDYFFDTEFANIGLANNVAPAMMGGPNTTTKTTPGMNIQDIFVTWKSLGDAFKIDVGYMLPPLSHNAVQGATTLYGWDYFAYTFAHNGTAAPFGFGQTGTNPVGRDTGLQLRGLVIGGMLEYRLGAFQGIRNDQGTEQGSSNMPRLVGRLQLNLMDAEPGFFYAGSYLGKKKIVSVGASYDYQKNPSSGSSFSQSYHTFSVDGFVDMPVGPGVLTAQVDYTNWNGGTMITGLPKNTIGSEAGYTIAEVKVSPIVRYERRWGGNNAAGTAPLTTIDRYAVGVAFWPFDHNVNLKLFYSRIQEQNAAHGANQVNAQLQLYYF